MRILKTKWFARYARKCGIADSALVMAIEEAERGVIDADSDKSQNRSTAI